MRLLGGQHLSDITFILAAAEGTLHADECFCVSYKRVQSSASADLVSFLLRNT